MGCCTSKAFDDGEEISFSSPLIENLRNTVESIGASYDAKEITHKILNLLDDDLRSRFLDNLISKINLPAKGYFVPENELPDSVSRYLDQNTRNLCIKENDAVDCYQLLNNVILSSHFIPYPCDDIEKRYICHQFSSSKDYKSFLYGLSTMVLDRKNVCEYSATYSFGEDSVQVSPVELFIIESIPHILDKEPTAGNWDNFCKRNGLNPNQNVKLPSLQPVISIKLPVMANEKVQESVKEEPLKEEEEEEEEEEKKEEPVKEVKEEKKEEPVKEVEKEKEEEQAEPKEVKEDEKEEEEKKEEAEPKEVEEKEEEAEPVKEEEEKKEEPVKEVEAEPVKEEEKKEEKEEAEPVNEV